MYVFISGAITGVDDYEMKFAKVEKDLKELGHLVYNPVKIGKRLKHELGREPTYDEYLKRDLEYLDVSEAICHVEGWEKSKGANIEHKYAVEHGKIVLQYKMLSRRW